MQPTQPHLSRSDSASSRVASRALGEPSTVATRQPGRAARSDSAGSLNVARHEPVRSAYPIPMGWPAPPLPAVHEDGGSAPRRPWLRYALGSGLGAGTFAALTVGINRLVQYRVAHAQVSSDPGHWADVARGKYAAYYDGCDDCDDVNWAYNAYQYIRAIRVPSTLCDAAAMWFWPAPERFPAPCLDALGGTLRAEALGALQHEQRNYYTLIIPAFAAGVGVFATTVALGHCLRRRRHAAATQEQT